MKRKRKTINVYQRRKYRKADEVENNYRYIPTVYPIDQPDTPRIALPSYKYANLYGYNDGKLRGVSIKKY